ncbi:unnamed protein product [Euphydryas editha]|uniref:Uncharacterized protein n=1 Tax=Euphydryas editha TaxID=104508 RepID=A0AAU9UYG7_EUPED|nr:unnamed protein product [Euphydryas editha]
MIRIWENNSLSKKTTMFCDYLMIDLVLSEDPNSSNSSIDSPEAKRQRRIQPVPPVVARKASHMREMAITDQKSRSKCRAPGCSKLFFVSVTTNPLKGELDDFPSEQANFRKGYSTIDICTYMLLGCDRLYEKTEVYNLMLGVLNGEYILNFDMSAISWS